ASEALQPIARPQGAGTETATALASRPESAASVVPSGETVTGLEPDARVPGVQPLESEAAPATVLPSEQEAARPVERPVETALLVPARPGSTPGPQKEK